MKTIKLFLSTMLVFFIIDVIWIGFIARNIYFESVGPLLKRSGDSLDPNWPAAILVYVFFAIGILVFVVNRANGNYLKALKFGALLGFVIYGVYDFTNLSLLADWPLKITLIDLVWGTTLCAIVGVIATWIQKRI